MTGLRRCGGGKRWGSKGEAERSKKARNGSYMAFECRCSGWHLQELVLAPMPTRAPKSKPADSKPETFGPVAVLRIDVRDSDDSGAVLVRLCQGCGSTRNLHRHHRRGKDAGGSGERAHTHCACNGLTLCTTCHTWAHANPEQARAEGWIVSQSVDEPGSVGVMRFAAAEGGATQFPSCDGRWLETAPEMREVTA